MNRKNIGSKFDDFLKEENLFEQVDATAVKRMLAAQIALGMKRNKLTKTEMANRMRTSRAALDRLLDPENASITLSTLERAASALGKKLRLELA
jgi:antitoxin HicB